MKMKRFSITFLAIISLSSLLAQTEVNPTDKDDPFGPADDTAQKYLEEYSAPKKAKNNRDFRDFLIPTFNSQVANPNMRFITSRDHTIAGTVHELLAINAKENSTRVEELLNELKSSVKSSEETESEDWVQIRTPEFDAIEARVFILFPDLPKDDTSPFYGIRIYDKDGDISEFYFANRVVASKWVQLIEELQSVIIKKRAEQAAP
jgi:hypothetical protein